MSDERQHLHTDDYPNTLRLLGELLGHREDREELGYGPTEHGAFVDWEALADGKLSSTERAAVHIARGCATLERHGGLPPRLRSVVVDVVEAVAGPRLEVWSDRQLGYLREHEEPEAGELPDVGP